MSFDGSNSPAGRQKPSSAVPAAYGRPAPAQDDGELLRFLVRLSRFGLAAGMEPLLKPLKPAG